MPSPRHRHTVYASPPSRPRHRLAHVRNLAPPHTSRHSALICSPPLDSPCFHRAWTAEAASHAHGPWPPLLHRYTAHRSAAREHGLPWARLLAARHLRTQPRNSHVCVRRTLYLHTMARGHASARCRASPGAPTPTQPRTDTRQGVATPPWPCPRLPVATS